MHKITLTLVGLVAALGVSMSLQADIKPNQAAMTTAAKDGNDSTADTSTLRCWQYGELLFEEAGIANSTLQKESGVIEFKRKRNSQGKLQLLDFGTATCLYEE